MAICALWSKASSSGFELAGALRLFQRSLMRKVGILDVGDDNMRWLRGGLLMMVGLGAVADAAGPEMVNITEQPRVKPRHRALLAAHDVPMYGRIVRVEQPDIIVGEAVSSDRKTGLGVFTFFQVHPLDQTALATALHHIPYQLVYNDQQGCGNGMGALIMQMEHHGRVRSLVMTALKTLAGAEY